MNNHKKSKSSLVKSETTYKKMAYDFIYEKIARGQYAHGKRIVSKNIAEEMGISLAPVREAIMEMASSGLIEYRPHVGAIVKEVSNRELFQYLKLRGLVEPFAASEAAKYASNIDLVNIEKVYQRMLDIARKIFTCENIDSLQKNFIRFNHADMRFHIEILKATKNLALKRFGKLLMDSFYLNGTKRTLTQSDIETYKAATQENLDSHLVLLRALLKRDPQQAEQAMLHSLDLGKDNILEKDEEEIFTNSLDEELINSVLV